MTPPTTAPTAPAALSPSLEPRSIPPGTPWACAATGSATAATRAAIPIKRRIMNNSNGVDQGDWNSAWFPAVRRSSALRAIACLPAPSWCRLGDTADGIDDPSPERANSTVARLFSTGHQINGLSVTGRNIERRHQLSAKSRSCLDQGRHGERDAKPLLRGLQHRRDAVEPKMSARGQFCNPGLVEPGRPGARPRGEMDQHLTR